MTSDYIEEELKIMEEMTETKGGNMSASIDVNDQIKILDLNLVVLLDESLTVREVLDIMQDNKYGCVVLKNAKGEPSGIFTERDLLMKVMLGEAKDLASVKVSEYMTPNPVTLDENDPIAFALNKMSDGSFRHIPITSKGAVKYMLSVKDIVDQISNVYRNSVLNLPPDLKQTTTQYGG